MVSCHPHWQLRNSCEKSSCTKLNVKSCSFRLCIVSAQFKLLFSDTKTTTGQEDSKSVEVQCSRKSKLTGMYTHTVWRNAVRLPHVTQLVLTPASNNGRGYGIIFPYCVKVCVHVLRDTIRMVNAQQLNFNDYYWLEASGAHSGNLSDTELHVFGNHYLSCWHTSAKCCSRFSKKRLSLKCLRE